MRISYFCFQTESRVYSYFSVRSQVRGPAYLEDKKKMPAKGAVFGLVGVDLLSFEDPTERFRLLNHPSNPLRRIQDDPEYAQVRIGGCVGKRRVLLCFVGALIHILATNVAMY